MQDHQQSLSIDHQERISRIQAWADDAADSRGKWRKRNAYFHKLDQDYLRFLVSPGQRVLALGCGVGEGFLAEHMLPRIQRGDCEVVMWRWRRCYCDGVQVVATDHLVRISMEIRHIVLASRRSSTLLVTAVDRSHIPTFRPEPRNVNI